MANPEHLAILEDALDNKDINVWNKWRKDSRFIHPDLSYVNLSYANLGKVNLSYANFYKANLSYADLSYSDLSYADLSVATLYNADLRSSNLRYTDLSSANLGKANLGKADVSSADLRKTNLLEVDFTGVDFEKTIFNITQFNSADLSTVKNLDKADVQDPCTIGIDTLYKSQAILGESWFQDFLRECGVPDTMVTYASSLVVKPFDYYSCFISYSSKDEDFCQELQSRMKREGLRVWFAPEEMKGGRKIHEQIFEAIHYHDKLILVITEASMNSNWVELEIKRARKREQTENRRVLFPIMLTSYEQIQDWELITSDGEDLAEEIRQYYIPNFSNWKDYDAFTREFDKLIDALKADD